MPKFSRGVFWGRFNPPHKGHLEVIKYLLEKECKELVVAIGSAQASHTEKNPFTGGERLLMMKALLAEAGLESRTIIVQVPDDADSYVNTASNLRLFSPKFDCVFTNRAVIRDIFSSSGMAVVRFPDFDYKKFSGSNVRAAMLSGKNWEELVPKAVYTFIKENGLLERLKTVERDKYQA